MNFPISSTAPRRALLLSAMLGCASVAAPFAAGVAHAQVAKTPLTEAPITTPAGGQSLLKKDNLSIRDKSDAADNENGVTQRVKVDGPGFKNALRATSKRRGDSWNLETRIDPQTKLNKGQAVLVRFWARSIQTSDESGQGLVNATFGETSPPWRVQFSRGFTVGNTWQEFVMRGTVDRDYEADQVALKIGFGLVTQTMEIGGVQIIAYPAGTAVSSLPETRSSYAGRELDAPWRAAAAERIRVNRTAPFQIQVIDRTGKLISDATVHVALKKHAFQFGAAVNASTLVTDDRPENAKYRERMLELFNAGSFYNNLKWEAWAGEWGESLNQAATLQGLEWLRAHGMAIRGHVLAWPSFHNMPTFIKKLEDKDAEKAGEPAKSTATPDELERLVLSRVDDVTQATAPYISEWDVINEPRDNHDLMDIIGRHVMLDIFQRAHNRLPNARLVLNDYSILSMTTDSPSQQQYEDYVRYLIDNGAPISGLGLQSHFGATVPTPMYVDRVLNRFAALGLPIRVTEFTIAGDDDALKADWTRDFLTMLFSHPEISGFQMWGLEEAVKPDGTLTPLGEAYRKLVKDTWKTDITAQTSAGGSIENRGYLGRYDITVTQGDRTITVSFDLRQNSQPLIVTLP